jgi:hypothetical protein
MGVCSWLNLNYLSKPKDKMHPTPIEQEAPLPRALRTYTLHSNSGANSRNLAIVPEGSNSARYTTSIAPVIDMKHPNSITLYSPSSSDPVVGVVRMYQGCDTINLALGDPEDFANRENCTWEDMHATASETKATTHEFGLGLGDELRREFQWVLVEPAPVPHPPAHSEGHSARVKSWSITEHVHGISRTKTWNFNSKSSEKKEAAVTTVHEVHPEDPTRRSFKLIDRNVGETVALVLRHETIFNGALVNTDDDGDMSTRGKVVIFRDFWESGRYQEDWDKMVILSGLAILEKEDRE